MEDRTPRSSGETEEGGREGKEGKKNRKPKIRQTLVILIMVMNNSFNSERNKGGKTSV